MNFLSNPWDTGKRNFAEMGFGTRFTSFYRSESYFVSMPGGEPNPDFIPILRNYGSSSRIANDDPSLLDSVYVSSPRIYSLNLYVNLSLHFGKLRVGVNGDLIGFSFGEPRTGTYINGSVREQVHVVPKNYNSVFESKGDVVQGTGSLNTEVYATYQLVKEVSIKVAMKWTKMEYVTNTNVQQYPSPNDQFVSHVHSMSVGVVYVWRRRESP